MDYKISNKVAILKAEEKYGKLRDAEDKYDPTDVIEDLKFSFDLCCSKCGLHNISWKTLKFYNFDPSVICWDCQHN